MAPSNQSAQSDAGKYTALRGQVRWPRGSGLTSRRLWFWSAGAVTINYGVFINVVISFLIVVFAVFLLIKGINKL